MKKSRLEVLIGQLNSKELKKLHKFVSSPYFNQQQNLVRLLEYCITNKDKVLDKKAAYKMLFEDKAYKDVELRLQMSYLYKLVEKFLAYSIIETDTFLLNEKITEGYKQHNLSKFTLRSLDKTRVYMEKQPLRNAKYFEQIHQINLAQLAYNATVKPTEQYSKVVFKEMDIAYIITKLKLTCTFLSQQTTYQASYDLSSLETIIQQIDQQDLLKVPAVATYYYCYLTLTQPNAIQHFEQFHQLLLANSVLFSEQENRSLYLLAINFCIKQINQGNTPFYSKTLDLYKAGLENQALLENGILSRFTYHNIVSAGILSKEYDWVEQFIFDYRKALEKRYQESAFSFSKAHLEYRRKNYEGVLDLLQKSNYRDVLLNLGAKTLLLKVYYERSEFDLLYSHLEAMKNYTRRKRVIGYHKTNYLNIIQFTQKLLELNFYNKEAIKNLAAKIKETPILTEKAWLLEQLE